MTRDWRDGFAEFFGQGADDSVAGGRKLKPGGNGVVDTDLWDTIWGRSQSELNTAYSTSVADELEKKYKNQLNSLKPGSYVRGSDEGTYLSQLRNLQRTDDNKAFKESPEGQAVAFNQGRQTKADDRLATAQEQANTLAQNTLTSQTNLAQATLQSQERSQAFQRRENKLDRAQTRELSEAKDNLQLQMAIMSNDLSEKRMDYDRETARMDKRDRMIAQLMSGLGQLGSAFG